MLSRPYLLLSLLFALTLCPSHSTSAIDEESAGCREELIFQIVKPKLSQLLRGISKARTLAANLEVTEAKEIPTALKAPPSPPCRRL